MATDRPPDGLTYRAEIANLARLIRRANRKSGTIDAIPRIARVIGYLATIDPATIARLVSHLQFPIVLATLIDDLRKVAPVWENSRMDAVLWRACNPSAWTLSRLQIARCTYFISFGIGKPIWCNLQLDGNRVVCKRHESRLRAIHHAIDAHIGPQLASICLNHILPDAWRVL